MSDVPEFKDYLAVRTIDTENSANTNYVDLASTTWIFNGSGDLDGSGTGLIGDWKSSDAAHENTTDGVHTTGAFSIDLPGVSVSLPSGFPGAQTPANILIFSNNGQNWIQVPIPAGE